MLDASLTVKSNTVGTEVRFSWLFTPFLFQKLGELNKQAFCFPEAKANQNKQHNSQWCLDPGVEQLLWMEYHVMFQDNAVKHCFENCRSICSI